MDLGLNGKVAVVTGAGSGIGLSVCKMLTAENVNVVGGDLAVDSLESLAEGNSVVSVEVDLGTSGGPEKLIECAKSNFGDVDILINCVGVGPVLSLIHI